MNVTYLGIDLAKNVFQLCGLNQTGKPVKGTARVAVANKNARIIWSMLRNDTEYQAVGS